MNLRVPRSTWVGSALLALGGLGYLCLAPQTVSVLTGGAAREATEPDTVRRQSELEQRWEEVTARTEARQRLVREVIAGRLALAEAAARFQELDLASGNFNWDRFRAAMPGASDEEKQRRAVIEHVKSALVGDPERERAVTARLEQELRALEGGAGNASSGEPRAEVFLIPGSSSPHD